MSWDSVFYFYLLIKFFFFILHPSHSFLSLLSSSFLPPPASPLHLVPIRSSSVSLAVIMDPILIPGFFTNIVLIHVDIHVDPAHFVAVIEIAFLGTKDSLKLFSLFLSMDTKHLEFWAIHNQVSCWLSPSFHPCPAETAHFPHTHLSQGSTDTKGQMETVNIRAV